VTRSVMGFAHSWNRKLEERVGQKGQSAPDKSEQIDFCALLVTIWIRENRGFACGLRCKSFYSMGGILINK
jgi:hypothetical protein